eukprot:gnl/MRDRNA2_/MRDRNA2_243583_c0_seq1.p2 gnl/MRDRNA2_/MRDRNA2_243583_c0~~gnl/MRDRNA2_/MRDRNA2_243583_c0_seq1.p2  ORF type:complete len:141 (+),score=20.36 gnl/MRDRNA2_/MRDRNA2_243583_c0_seq1:600-1022(+)
MMVKRGADTFVPEHKAPPPMEFPPEIAKLYGPGTFGFTLGTSTMKGTALHHAAASGNVEACKELVKNGVDPKALNVLGNTAKQVASAMGYPHVEEYLEKIERQGGEPTSPTSPMSPMSPPYSSSPISFRGFTAHGKSLKK